MQPLVSCIIATANRRTFISRAIQCFLNQNWENKELLILDDGKDPIGDLVPHDGNARITYTYNPVKRELGPKLNELCDAAMGEYIIQWDDDDWSSPDRIALQIEPLVANPNLQISGTSCLYYYRYGTQEAFCYTGKTEEWIGGIGFPKAVWRALGGYPNIGFGLDYYFLKKVPMAARHDLRNPAVYVGTIHPANMSPKLTHGREWKQISWDLIAGIKGFSVS